MKHSNHTRPKTYGDLGRLIRRRTRGDDGIALPMVLIIFIVGFLLVSALVVSITGASNVTATSRSTVQATAAAEAGIADVLGTIADPAASVCDLTSAVTDPTGVVSYEAHVEFGTPGSFTPPTTWNTSCPTTDTLVRITSIGTTDGAKQKIERIHEIHVTTPPPTEYTDIIFSSGAWDFGSNTELKALDPARPSDVMISSGNFDCSNSGTIHGSVYVKSGNAKLDGACRITGNLEVSGNLVREGSAFVEGSVVVGGTVSLKGGAPAIQGSLTHGGTLTLGWGTKSDWVRGAVNQTPVTMTPPPTWNTLGKAEFVAAGYAPINWTGSCTIAYSTAHPMPAVLQGLTKPTVIDASACATLTIRTDITLKLGDNVAFIAPKINFEAFTFGSTNSEERDLYVVSTEPQTGCVSGRQDIIVSGVKFTDKKVSGLLYATCRVHMNNWGPYWQGSIYSKFFSGAPLLTFSPVPDLSGGSGSVVVPPGSLVVESTPVSVRSIAVDG